MTLSIITVVRNDSAGLARTIQSVRSQSYSEIEFIVVDGGSDDGTVNVIRANEDLIDYWESRSDRGIYDAMNKGLKRATGAFVLFLNAGDEFYAKHSLENTARAIDQNPLADVLYFQAIREDLRPARGFDRQSAILFDSVGNHQAVLVRTSVHQQFPFDTHYRIKADRDAQLRMHLAGCRIVAVPEVISRSEGGGVSSTAIPRKEWENIGICWNNRVGMCWLAVAVLLAAARVSLFWLARLGGLDWETTKSRLAGPKRLRAANAYEVRGAPPEQGPLTPALSPKSFAAAALEVERGVRERLGGKGAESAPPTHVQPPSSVSPATDFVCSTPTITGRT